VSIAERGTRASANRMSERTERGKEKSNYTGPERTHFAEILGRVGYLLGLLFFDPEYGGSAYFSETVVNLYWTSQRYILEYRTLHSHLC
jgi:hypothetical protein